MEYNGKKIVVAFEDEEKLIFTYGKKVVRVTKTATFEKNETRWFERGGLIYNDIEVKISDGEAFIVGCNSVETVDGMIDCPEHTNDKFHLKFPTLKEILTNEEKFEEALYYSEEIGEDFDEYLEKSDYKIDVKFFFEGFFFGGEHLRIVNDEEDEEEVETKEIEDNIKRYDEAYKLIAKCAENAIPQIKEIVNHYSGSVEVCEIAMEMGVESISVNYDGGNHPEYDSNVFSEVDCVFVRDGRLFVDTEDAEIEASDLSATEIMTILEWLYNYHTDGTIEKYINSNFD